MKLFIGKTKRIIVALLLTLFFLTIGQAQYLMPAFASTYGVDAFPVVVDQYSINIPFTAVPNKALQSLAFTEGTDKKIGNELYLTTRSGDTTYVIRCGVNGKAATAIDYIVLDNFGHGESLEVIKEGGRTYLWLGSAAFDNVKRDPKRHYWSTKISCIEYIPAAAGKILASSTVLKTFTIDKNGAIAKDDGGHEKSNPNRVYERVSIAFSTSSICIRQTNTDTLDSMFVYFNNITGGLTNANIESALLGKTNKTISTVLGGKDAIPQPTGVPSYQSHDIYNGNIYVAGGRLDGDAGIRKLQASTGKDRGLTGINNYNGLEMEGIKVNNKYIFYMLRPESDNKTNTKIYCINLL